MLAATSLTGLNRGPAGLVNPLPRKLLPGAAPNPSLGIAPPTGAAPAPAAMPAATPAPTGLMPFTGGMANTLSPTAASPAPSATPLSAGAAMPPATPSASAPMPAATPPAPTLNGVSVTGIDPTNDLRNSTIAPTNAVDRYSLMADRLKNYDATAVPAYQAQLRKTFQGNAALGRLGSGMLNTDVGNLDLATENARNSEFGNLLADATQGTITDAANNRNELRTERGYQTGAEADAYNRSRQGVMDTNTLTDSAAGRALAQEQAGFANDPANLVAQLSAMSGQQAAGGAAGVGSSSSNQSYIDLLKQILAQGQGQVPTTPQVPIPTTPPVRG